MTTQTVPVVQIADARALAVFDGDGPRPQFVLDSEKMKALVAGLEPGQRIPSHPEAMAVYYFLEGEGVMTVDGEEMAVAAGSLVIAPPGSARGLRATSRLSFLAVRSGA